MKKNAIWLVLFLCSFHLSAKNIYVSASAQNNGDGSKRAPFSTLKQAQKAIRNIGLKEKMESIQIVLLDGNYSISSPVIFTAKDGGSATSPLIVKAAHPGKVFLSSATSLSSSLFKKATDQEKQYLKPSAKDHVYVAKLTTEQMAQFGDGQGNYGALVWNEHFLQLARWPNRGYNLMGKVLDMGPTSRWLKKGENAPSYSYSDPSGGTFCLEDSINQKVWQTELNRTHDIRLDGYISIDWEKYEHQIARISDKAEFQLLNETRYGIGGVARPGSKQGKSKPKIMNNRRLYFKNILCELDMPGEWYVDRRYNKLYLWPIGDFTNANLSIPCGKEMLLGEGFSHIRFQGITFENGGEQVLSFSNVDDVHFEGCTFRNLKGRVGSLHGTNSGFLSCDFYNMNTCLTLSGGDPKALKKANNYIQNCDFHDFRDCGYGAVALHGCGLTFSNNIYHQISSGISYSGIYITLENSEFFDVGWGMGDWNTIYQGADIWCNGNRVENNFFHHMFGFPGISHPIVAVRNDDGGSGTTYKSNLFYKTGKGGIVAMGPSCHIQDNIAIDCGTLWRTNKRPISKDEIAQEYQDIIDMYESGRFPRGGKEDRIYNAEVIIGEKGWDKDLFKNAFPNFTKYMHENPFAQSYSSITNSYSNQVAFDYPYNIYYIHGSFQLTENDGGVHHKKKMEVAFPASFDYNEPHLIRKSDFEDISVLDFRIKKGFETCEGFEPCNMSDVGLYKDKFRVNPPKQECYRKSMYDRYRFRLTDATGLNYDSKNNSYFPRHAWLPKETSEKLTSYPYLSGIEDNGWFAYKPIRHDTNFRGLPIQLRGKTYEKGLSIAPDKEEERSEIVFDLALLEKKKVKSLQAVVGIDESYGSKSARCKVLGKIKGEWQTLFESQLLQKGKDPELFKVDIKECTEVKLQSRGQGTVVWANAKFID